MSQIKSVITAALTAISTFALGNVVIAADAAPSEDQLDMVTVTAQKREERIIDVPISIAAITNKEIADSGAVQLSDFLQTVPGVGIIDDGSGQQFIQIRGINSTFGNSPVGYYLDELPFTYLGNTQLPDVRTYDLKRVEVLRGPQGTLYGDGSLGGTIRVLTNDPNLSAFQGSLDLTGGSTSKGSSSGMYKGMVNIPLQDDLVGLRLVASHEDFGGWVDNTSTGATLKDANTRKIDNYRRKLRFAVNERLDVVLSAWQNREVTRNDGRSLADYSSPLDQVFDKTKYDLFGATVRYQFDAFDVVSATSYMDFARDDATAFFGAPFTTVEKQEILNEELRFTSRSDGMFRWTSGLAFRNIKRHTLLDLQAFAFTQDITQRSKSYAVFGEGTWSFFDRKLDATLGLRYFKDDSLNPEPIDPATMAFIRSRVPSFTGTNEPNFNSFTPRLNVAYHINKDWLVYANFAKGFRTGQSQPIISLVGAIARGVTLPTGIEPESLLSYEVGTKGSFLDGRLLFEAAAFYNDWKDLQVAVVVQNPVRGLVNGGKARTQGLEIGLTAKPIDGLTLQLTAGTVDAKFREDFRGINIKKGDRIPEVPKTTLAASASYRWPFGRNDLNGFVYAGVQHNSDRTDTINFAVPSDATTIADLRLGIEGKTWGLYLFGDNINDEKGAIDVFAFGATGPALRYRPRTFGINLRLKKE